MKIDELRISDELKEMLKSTFNISTVKQLLEIPCKDLYKAIEDFSLKSNVSYLSGKLCQRSLAHSIHGLGLCLKDEYADIKLPLDVAFIKILDLEISVKLKNVLIHANINILGELLTYDFEDLKRLRGMGDVYLKELKDYVHGLGYSLMNEEPSINEKKSELRARGLKVLEDEGLPVNVCGTLYRNDIYTLGDLMSYGIEVFNIVGFGPLKKQILRDFLQSLGIELKVVSSNSIEQPLVSSPTAVVIQRLRAENEAIGKRIDEKNLLIDEYKKLMAEQQHLLQREQELDARIQELASEIKGVSRDRKKD